MIANQLRIQMGWYLKSNTFIWLNFFAYIFLGARIKSGSSVQEGMLEGMLEGMNTIFLLYDVFGIQYRYCRGDGERS